MKTAMQEVLNLVEQMFNNADALKLELPASMLNDIINIITQEGLQKEKEQIMKAVKDSYECTYNSCDSGCGGNIEIEFTPQEYYNQLYNQNK